MIWKIWEVTKKSTRKQIHRIMINISKRRIASGRIGLEEIKRNQTKNLRFINNRGRWAYDPKPIQLRNYFQWMEKVLQVQTATHQMCSHDYPHVGLTFAKTLVPRKHSVILQSIPFLLSA